MTDVVFARPRHTYASYEDFWRLATLSGYEVIFLDEVDTSLEVTYIFSTPDAETGYPHRFPKDKAAVIYWMLEWYDNYEIQPGVDEVWNSSHWFAQKIGAKYVPMGSHHLLCDGEVRRDLDKWYDFAFMSYMVPRRSNIRWALEQYNFKIAPNGWGTERTAILNRSRAMIHVHQLASVPVVAPLRRAIAASHRIQLVCEHGINDPEFNGRSIVSFPFNANGNQINETAKSLDVQEYGEFLYHKLCMIDTFRKCVEAAL